VPELSQDFTEGGIFSSDDLDVDPATGEIDLADASAGTYEVTYTVEEDPSTCLGGGTYTAEIELLSAGEPGTDFGYPMEEYCVLEETTVAPVAGPGFTEGGVFSAPDGLSIDAETGAISIADSAPGTYEITYTVEEDPENCTLAGSSTATVELTEPTAPETSFEYPEYEYCVDSDAVLPILPDGFSPEGLFSAGEGLDIDPESGEIDFSNTVPGEYTVTYDVDADDVLCERSGSSSFALTVYGEMDIEVTEDCADNHLILTVQNEDVGYGGDIGYIWRDDSGNVLDEQSGRLDVSNYLSRHSGKSLPLTFTVEADYGDCSSSAAYTVQRDRCGFIPRGISPNNDGKNDKFDLGHMDIRSIAIFNRYGTKVYNKDNGYTDEWFGQDNNGKDLPDGTYYYYLQKRDGSSVTGWVYVIRQH